MKQKKILVGSDARQAIMRGAFFLSDTVGRTLGPFGMNALIEKGNRVTNDGVSIAKEIILKDEIENRGARKLQEVASKTNDEAGDGTTASIVLAGAILKELDKYLPKEGRFVGKKRPIELINQIEQERKEVTAKLEAMAEVVNSEERLIEVATVSVEDPELGALIGKAQWDLGPEGYLISEETAESVSSVEMVKGIRIDNGVGTSIIFNNARNESLEVMSCRVIYTNYTIHDLSPLVQLIENLGSMGVKELVIVARAFTDLAITQCIKQIEGGLKIYPINAPYVNQAQIMYDMAAVLGGRFINCEEADLGSINVSDVGFVERLVARRYHAIFTGGTDEQTEKRIENRASLLEEKLEGEVSEFEKRQLRIRISQLRRGCGLIKVGNVTETERGYKNDKVEDAVNAVRHALQEGVVPGGGQALRKIALEMSDESLLKIPLQAPYDQIMKLAPDDFEIGPHVKDPLKVVRVGLQKACSVASTLATAEIVIAEEIAKPRYIEEIPK